MDLQVEVAGVGASGVPLGVEVGLEVVELRSPGPGLDHEVLPPFGAGEFPDVVSAPAQVAGDGAQAVAFGDELVDGKEDIEELIAPDA